MTSGSFLIYFQGEGESGIRLLKLNRISYRHDATFGVLLDDDLPFCVTLEREWLDNLRNISCIPEGTYICKRVISPKFGETFEVTDVPDRSHILFHKGNISDDTHGCIITGEMFDPLNGENAVLSSGKAFQEFLSRLENTGEFSLIIYSSSHP